MNVVGLDGGDFHSINVAASDSNARIRKTCPGNPPRVTMEPLEAAWLVQVLSEKNTHSGADVTFTGSQSLDPARFQDSLPQVARDFLEGNPTLGPTAGRGRNGRPAAAPTTTPFFNLPGVDPATTAEIERAMRDARGALRQAQANMPGGRLVYTFDWNLKPAGPPPP